MFKKLTKTIKKDLVNKNKDIIKKSLIKSIRESKSVRNNIESKTPSTFNNLKKLSLIQLRFVSDEIKDNNVLDALDKGHSNAINYLTKRSKNVHKSEITHIMNEAVEIACNDTTIILQEKENRINRLRLRFSLISIVAFMTIIILFN